ncbi:MAG: ABC transporter ATP-binding protein [Alphaproteobacteria bacterium]|nr:ABC transporter ATP-binding protein [Alphaproteobacteria bacterium]
MKNSGLLKRLLFFTRPHLFYLALALVFAVVSVCLTLYAPVLTGQAIDKIIGRGNVDFAVLKRLLIWFAAVTAGASVAQWLMGLCTNKIAYLTVRDIREKAFAKLQNVPLKFIDSTPHGDILSRVIVDAEQIADGLLMGFTQLFTGLVTIFGTIGFMLAINVKITLLVVFVTPLSLFVANFIAKHSFKFFKIQSETRGEMTALIEETIGNMKLVKAFGYEGEASTRFEEINGRLKKCGVKALFFSSMTNPCTRFVNGVVYTLVGIVGALTAVAGALTVGQLSCFLSYANQYTKPFNEISGVIAELQSALASAKRLFDVIDATPQTPDSADAFVLGKADGSVEVKDVSFSYVPEIKLIEGLSLSVRAGQKIAIVGTTGCGKTTLINLLMRFYDVNKGQIVVSGHDVRNITRDSLRSSFGMVLQDTWLKAGTVRENIAYGKPNASDYEIVSAAVAAHADSFIKRLPKGYDTEITEDGGNISQGQKQLLCIARAMLSLPSMLILDEATSSIDTRTEARIQKAFDAMMQGRTSFIVAHRLSTIRRADLILVMDSGHIIEQGKHEELLAKKGFYANLYNSQFAV